MGFQAIMGIIHATNITSSTLKPKPKGSASLAAVISAFVPTWFTGLIFVVAFVLIRCHFPKIYSPRTYMGTIPEKHRSPAQGRAYLHWVRIMYRLPDKFLLYHESLDAYLYLRFFRTIIFICVVGSCLTWPTLMPVNAVGRGSTGLDKIGIGNVDNKSYFYAHAVLAWVFLGFVMFTIARERLWLIGLRQAWAVSKHNSSKLSSRAVLFLSCPHDALQESNKHRFFGDGAVRIWPVTQVKWLEALVSDRNSKVRQLESAEVSLIQNARTATMKERRKNSSQDIEEPNYESLPSDVKKAIRPKHRLTYSATSEKIDAIKWCRESIKDVESDIERIRREYGQKDADGPAAIFVEFETIADAQRAFLQVSSTDLLALSPRYIGVSPKEIVWKNLLISPARRFSQESIAVAIVISLIVFWSIPSGFIGLISNISYLAENVDWLAWLDNLPGPIMGLLSGLVPPLLTSLLSKYVAKIFRFIFKSFGGATTIAIELKVQKWFYIFQVVQVFLVTAVFSGASTVFSELLKKARDPISIPEMLAKQLPSSSNYYLTYFIVQGITSSTDNILNWSDLLQYLAFYRFFDKTPRQKFNRYTSMKGIAWGKLFPKFANFAIIAIAYSCIAPLVLGFATIGLVLYYFSYRYNLLFVMQPKIDTQGQAYTIALQHLLTGVYISELALIGLFGLNNASGPGIMTIILFIITVLYNVMVNKYLGPLEMYLPAEVAHEHAARDESTPLLSSAEEGRADGASQSHIQRLGQQAHAPQQLIDPLARFFEPHVFASYESMKRWLREDEQAFRDLEEDAPQYSEDQLQKTYLNPALTSSTPVIWLPKDEVGASSSEVRENEEAGLKSSDQAAWVDRKGKVRWDELDFKDVPIWKSMA